MAHPLKAFWILQWLGQNWDLEIQENHGTLQEIRENHEMAHPLEDFLQWVGHP